MDWGSLFFTFSGRISRAKYWIAVLVFLAIYLACAALEFVTESMAVQAVSGMVTIVLLISGAAVGVKRLHDRNKSGWYLLLFYVLPATLFTAGVMIGPLREGSALVANGLGLAAFAFS